MKSNYTGVVVGALVVVAVILGVVHYQKNNSQGVNSNNAGLYVGVTDATADIDNVDSVDMSIKKVEVWSASKGWVTVSDDDKTFSLLDLHATGRTELYTKNTDLDSGAYSKVRVTLGDTMVHTKTNGDVKATTPSHQVVMNSVINLKSGANANLKLDFLADKSLHKAASGAYVFAPVVNAESQSNADVTVSEDDTLTSTGGTVDSSATVGMDLSGVSRSNFVLDTDSSLKIGTSNGNQRNFMLGGKNFMSDDSQDHEDVDEDNSSKGSLDVNIGGKANNSSDDHQSEDDSAQGGLNLNY